MKFLVGTLYSHENEYEACVAALYGQTGCAWEHLVIANQPNKQAHDSLYAAFMARADEFDCFVKVDADMVLYQPDLFARIAQVFTARPQIKDLEIAVFDFFSQHLSWGLHAFRSGVRWIASSENLFVDTCPLAEFERLRDDADLAPAAAHCPNPSPFQAFHYGVHRALKLIQPGRRQVDANYSLYHWLGLERTRRHYARTRDLRVGYAVLGAELAFCGGVRPADLDYTNVCLQDRFALYAGLDERQLHIAIGNIRWRNLGFLPGRLRYRWLTRRRP